MSKHAPDGDVAARLAQRAEQFLVHSFLYYKLGESVLDDATFDRYAEELRRLRSEHPDAPMPYAKLIDPLLGPEASGHAIREYPPEIITEAFQLLYAVTSPALEFEEFVERRGYTVQREDNA